MARPLWAGTSPTNSAVCHGCAFGLEHRGRPIKKPWKIKSTHPPMIEELSRHKCSCQGGKHLPCTGKLASDSENDTPKKAKAIIDAVLTPYAKSLAPRNEAVASLNARMSEIDGESLDLSYGNDPICGEPLPEERAFSSQFNTGTG